jgi:hypothetical protein
LDSFSSETAAIFTGTAFLSSVSADASIFSEALSIAIAAAVAFAAAALAISAIAAAEAFPKCTSRAASKALHRLRRNVFASASVASGGEFALWIFVARELLEIRFSSKMLVASTLAR